MSPCASWPRANNTVRLSLLRPAYSPLLRSRRLTLLSGTANFLPPTTCARFRAGPGLRPCTAQRSHRTGSDMMRTSHLTSLFAALLIAGATPALAQNQPRGQQPPPPAQGRTLQAGDGDAAAADRRPQLRGLPQADGRSGAAQGSRRAGQTGRRPGLLLAARARRPRRQEESRHRQSRCGARPQQQGRRRLGHAGELCRRSDRRGLARAKGRDLRARRSEFRPQGVRSIAPEHANRRGRLGLSGLRRPRGPRRAAGQRAGRRKARQRLRAHHAGKRTEPRRLSCAWSRLPARPALCRWIQSRRSATTRSATSRMRAAGKSAAISAAATPSNRIVAPVQP